MQNVTFDGVDGVFIPESEFMYIKEVIKNNNLLLVALLDAVNKSDRSCFDYLLDLE